MPLSERAVAPSPPEIDAAPSTLRDLRHALECIARVLRVNEPHKRGRWRRESAYSHAQHAAAHLAVWCEQRHAEDLEHALVRCAMAVEVSLNGCPENASTEPKQEEKRSC